MTASINLIFGCHSHQPIGNFPEVFREAYEKAYRPFVDVLERHPHMHVTLHYTGPLLDWFLENEPDFIARLRNLIQAGQVEIMGGAYYEPLLCAIPERDGIQQIERMNRFCEKHFGEPPAGMWLAERVWEPHLPHIAKKAGITYTALDDTHFQYSGMEPEELFGYYVTENEGYTLNVFPILKQLRYSIPFHAVWESIDFLRQNASEEEAGEWSEAKSLPPRCAVIHDDGEKFGIWPETYRSVYEEGWLEEFFQEVGRQQDWLHSVTYSEFMRKAPALGRTYLTCASYEEMMAWALPPHMQRRLNAVTEWANNRNDAFGRDVAFFTRGGFWRNFLAKYPESNNIQKRMLFVSRKIREVPHKSRDERYQEAKRLLHEGQCNCAYWHGVFGGLYLNHLRTALYEKLIRAETIVDSLTDQGENEWMQRHVTDFDADGYDEVILESPQLWAGLSPRDGGTLFELDLKPKAFNFLNTLARREELYHDAVLQGQAHEAGTGEESGHSIHEIVRVKEQGLEQYLSYDPYRRVSLRDHFIPADTSPEALWRANHEELGDFAAGVYSFEMGRRRVTLRRQGQVWAPDGRKHAVSVTKSVQFEKDASAIAIRYDIDNVSNERMIALFGVEFAANFLSGAAFDRYYWSEDRDLNHAKLATLGCEENLRHIALRDDWQQLEMGLRFDPPARIYQFPIETVSQSEGGQERIYQGSVVLPCWPLHEAPEHRTTMKIRLETLDTGQHA